MTLVKKISPDWHPAEFITLNIGQVFDADFPVEQLLREGKCVLCDKDGNELSTYGATGILTEQELHEFRIWIETKKQKELQQEQQDLLAKVTEIKDTIAQATSTEKPKSDFGERMRLAREKKKAERLAKEQK